MKLRLFIKVATAYENNFSSIVLDHKIPYLTVRAYLDTRAGLVKNVLRLSLCSLSNVLVADSFSKGLVLVEARSSEVPRTLDPFRHDTDVSPPLRLRTFLLWERLNLNFNVNYTIAVLRGYKNDARFLSHRNFVDLQVFLLQFEIVIKYRLCRRLLSRRMRCLLFDVLVGKHE